MKKVKNGEENICEERTTKKTVSCNMKPEKNLKE
jgi:hypothetical protein